MTRLFPFLLLCLMLAQADAAIHCVRQAASGAATGVDWNNAYTDLPSTLSRGDTYYVADGSYGSHVFADNDSGSTVTIVKYATATNNGTATGWNNSYSVTNAHFLAPFAFRKDSYLIDGTKRGASPYTNGFGILIDNSVSPSSSDDVTFGDTSPSTASNITLNCVEIIGSSAKASVGKLQTYTDSGCTFWYGSANDTLEYSYIHDMGLCPVFMRSSVGDLIQNNYFARNTYYSWNFHSEGISASEGVGNLTVRNNYWQDIEGTAVIATASAQNYPQNEAFNWYIYGNIFWYTTNNLALPHLNNPDPAVVSRWQMGVGDGILFPFSIKFDGTLLFANNTIIGYGASASDNCSVLTGDGVNITTIGNLIVENNLWIDNASLSVSMASASQGGSGSVITNLTWAYNGYYNNSKNDTNSNVQSFGSQPLVNWQNWNFNLASNSVAGINLGSPYDVDINGNTRTTWSRGALEYVSGQQQPQPGALTIFFGN